MNEFLDGARLLGRGWGWWHRRPGTMAAGLVPAFVVGVLMVVALGTLLLNLGPVGDWLTPFADDWVPLWERVAEFAAQAIVLAAALVVVVVTFTALTLAVGEPFYDRIWRTVEQDSTGTVPDGSTGIWRGAVDGLALVTRGLVVAVLTGVLGLLPLVGTVVGWGAGVLLTGWLLAHELTSRALTARGIDRRERTALLRAHRARALGFGVATQLCFLVPGGAVATMPAAVAGSTLLAQSLLMPRPALAPPDHASPGNRPRCRSGPPRIGSLGDRPRPRPRARAGMTVPRTGRGDANAALDDLLALCDRRPVWAPDPERAFTPLPGRRVRQSAVLVLFGVLDRAPATTGHPVVARDLDVLLTRRSPALNHHPGQVSFPGGGIDPHDAGPEAAALREAQEETGVVPSGVRVLGTLPPLPVTVSRNLVTPVLAWWTTPSAVAADPAETVEVFRVPVADLLDPRNRVTAVLRRAPREHRGPAFTVQGAVVWGFTAYVLDRLFEALGWAVPWDTDRTVPAPL